MSNFDDVKNFMIKYGQEVKTNPSFPNKRVIQLRYDLIKEELDELSVAIKDKDIVEVADALGDMLYILCGTIIEHGMQYKIDEIFSEIQNSNMSKLGADGNPIYREDGKVLKGPNYKPPTLEDLF